MSTILDKIVAAKRVEIDEARARVPERELRAAIADLPAPRGFQDSLSADGPIKLIAEIKKASPSRGVIREDFQPTEIAQIYQQHGATCLSVLTDRQFFQGSLEILREVRKVVDLPILRKEFVLDTYQIWEARAAGADAVLLIAECLEGDQLRRLHDAIVELGMAALVEFYEPENLPRVLSAGARLIGINNRNLRTFVTDLDHSIRLRTEIPADCVVVGESGIHSFADVQRLAAAKIDAILVGEHLMAADDIGAAVRTLLRGPAAM